MRGIDLRQLRRRARPKVLQADMRRELEWDNNRLVALENSEAPVDPVVEASYLLALQRQVAFKAGYKEEAVA